MVIVALAVVISVPTVGDGPTAAHGAAVGSAAVALALFALSARRQASLLMAAAVAMVAAMLTAPDQGTALTRWLAIASLPMALGLAGLSLCRASRANLIVGFGALLAGPVRMLVYDPLLDPDCRACLPTATLFDQQTLASAMALVGSLAVALALVLSWRHSLQPVASLLVATAALAAGVLPDPPFGFSFQAAVFALAAALAGGLMTLQRLMVLRQRLQRLEDAFRTGRGIEEGLRVTLADPDLVLEYATRGRWVDDAGNPTIGPRRDQVTTLVGDGLARIHHRRDAGRTDLLATSLTPELRVNLEHARLSAVLEAQVRELHESRLRLVEYADASRRRLERDLHDGAQQHLLALGFDLRRAINAADASTQGDLEACLTETTRALEELRILARGVYPALLATAGLRPAVEAAGRRLGYGVTVADLPAGRFAELTEQTAYLLVAELAELAPVRVEGSIERGMLSIHVQGAQLPPGSVVRERVETLGGIVSVMSDSTLVRLPCG
jgi:signal transduction histidine kinase